MASSLAVVSATNVPSAGGTFVRLVLNDSTQAAIYLDDGSPRGLMHELLDAWLAEGNEIAQE